MPVKTKNVSCNGCGRVYGAHPLLLVECPRCFAGIGQVCKRPSEHEAAEFHTERERAAVIAGVLERECPANSDEQKRLTALYWLENPWPGMPGEWTAAATPKKKGAAQAALF